VAIQGHAPKHGSMSPWIAAPKPARNDGSFEAKGKLGQMRFPRGCPTVTLHAGAGQRMAGFWPSEGG